MLVQKGFKYRLYPNNDQRQKLLQNGGNTRFLWNYFLKQNMDYYKDTKKFIFWYDLCKSLPKLKQEYPFLKESIAQSLQAVARQFDRALKDSFKTEKGFPSFKKKSLLNDSFTCPQAWKLSKSYVYVPKIGKVSWVKHRELQGKPKKITITQDGDKWYCSVLCEYEIQDQEKKKDNIVGIDVGLKEFATFSDETVIPNPRYLEKYEKRLARSQRKLGRKQKGSNNRLKQRMKVRKIHEKIRNVRKDFLHKTSSLITKSYDGVVLEDLNVEGMMKNKYLAKSIADASWSELKRQLEYKCKWNFKHFIQVGRFEPTSKTCSNCGYIQDMPLSKRKFNCPNCEISIDRDLNAAINIKNIGTTTPGQGESQACGDGILSSVKQEKECLVIQAEAT